MTTCNKRRIWPFARLIMHATVSVFFQRLGAPRVSYRRTFYLCCHRSFGIGYKMYQSTWRAAIDFKLETHSRRSNSKRILTWPGRPLTAHQRKRQAEGPHRSILMDLYPISRIAAYGRPDSTIPMSVSSSGLSLCDTVR